MSAVATRERVAAIAARHGLEMVGVAPADPLPRVRERMRDAVASGRMARMDWMGGDRPEIATDLARLDAAARSVIVVAAPYAGRDRAAWDPEPDRLTERLAPVLQAQPSEPIGLIARYALGTDYHRGLRERLDAFAAELRGAGHGIGPVAYVDDRPLAERAFAERAGLGWSGKNANLLTHHRAGSWVFIGAVLSDAELPADEPVRTNCGSCTRCLSGCPTGAIVAPHVVDARRCISYLTIEHPGELDAASSRALGGWIFGCDVCQEVCPVNAEADDHGPMRIPLIPLVAWLLPMGARAFERALDGTALTRAGRHRLLRNAIAVLGNAAAGGTDAELQATARRLFEGARGDRRPEVRAEAERQLAALSR